VILGLQDELNFDVGSGNSDNRSIWS